MGDRDDEVEDQDGELHGEVGDRNSEVEDRDDELHSDMEDPDGNLGFGTKGGEIWDERRGNIIEGQTEIRNFVRERPVCGKHESLGMKFSARVSSWLLGRKHCSGRHMHDGWHKLTIYKISY